MDRYNDFVIDHLNDEQKTIALLIKDLIKSVMGREAFGGGCRAFHATDDWKHAYGQDSVLILSHDGGDLARFCSYDHQDYDAIEKLQKTLEKAGYFCEQCTEWYSAIYKI